MLTTTPLVLPSRLRNLASLAGLLERLEQRPLEVSAAQYRAVAAQLSSLLETTPQDDTLDALLDRVPALAELYENLQYRHAGLCRHELEPTLAAEQAATAAIQRAQRRI